MNSNDLNITDKQAATEIVKLAADLSKLCHGTTMQDKADDLLQTAALVSCGMLYLAKPDEKTETTHEHLFTPELWDNAKNNRLKAAQALRNLTGQTFEWCLDRIKKFAEGPRPDPSPDPEVPF